jgi:hypothetical protein
MRGILSHVFDELDKFGRFGRCAASAAHGQTEGSSAPLAVCTAYRNRVDGPPGLSGKAHSDRKRVFILSPMIESRLAAKSSAFQPAAAQIDGLRAESCS